MQWTIEFPTPLNGTVPVQTKEMCFKFWYYIVSHDDNEAIKVRLIQDSTIKDLKIINASDVYQQQWLHSKVSFMASNGDKLVISGKINFQESVIAIDDTLIQEFPCEPPGWCDFETGISIIAANYVIFI